MAYLIECRDPFEGAFMNTTAYVLGILLQTMAGIAALLQLRYAPRVLPWLLVAVSSLLIAIRRAATLREFVEANRPLAVAEVITLFISLTFFCGVLLMSRMFRKAVENESALRISEGRMSSAFEYAAIGMAFVALDGRWLKINRAVTRMLGYTEEELLAKDFQEITYPEDLTTDLFYVQQMLNGDIDTYQMEKRYYHKSGSLIWGLLSVSLVRDEQDRPLHFISQIQDITRRKEAEEALRASEEKFRNIFDRHAAVKLLIDPVNGSIIDANQAATAYYGWSKEEMRRMRIQDINTLSDEEVKQEMERAASLERSYFEFRHRRSDGSEHDVAVFSSNVGEANQLMLHSIIYDITERKKIEQELQFTRFAVDNLADMAFWMNAEGRFVYVNRASCNALGYSRDELLNMRVSDIDPLFPADRWSENWTKLRELKHNVLESQHRTREGRIFPVEINDNFIEIDGHEYNCAFARDITDRKRAEHLLAEQYRLIHTILETTPQLMVFKDRNGVYREVNQAFCSFMGNRKEAIIGKTDYDLFPPDDAALYSSGDAEVIETGDPLEKEMLVQSDVRSRWLHVVKSPVLDGEEKIIGVLCSVNDLTERKHAEEEREILLAQLYQAQKMDSIGRLAGGVAHDFNNMLGVILGYTEMVMEQMDPDQPQYDMLKEVHRAAERSADLTRQLLAFARKQVAEPKIIDLNETVEGMLKMLRRLIGEDIELIWIPEKNIAPIYFDSSQLDQILANLCINARDALSGTGRITIETANTDLDTEFPDYHGVIAPGRYVSLTVSDNGCGMDSETMARIFEPFFTTKQSGKGTGLGLATVYGIVKQNNGFTNVYSEEGQGTSFKIYLPRHSEDKASGSEQVPLVESDPGDRTILLVEDDLSILNMTETMLKKLGYLVLTASAPKDAIRVAKEYPARIDLLMTDVIMPEMNGRDLAENLKLSHHGIKVLFMSGYTANVIAHHGVLEEGLLFIQKPFQKKDLVTKLRQAFENKQGEPPVREQL